MNDISIVIQGKLNSDSLNNIDNYLKYGKVIISCYENDNLDLLNSVKFNENLTIIKNKQPIGDFFNYGNIYMQSYTSYNGIKNCNSEFVIKIRSDEYFYNLDVFIDNMLNNSNKLITTNIFFRPDSMYKFHISDHIIGGKTESLLNMFYNVILNCENNLYKQDSFKPTESRLFIEYLKYKKININENDSKNIIKNNVVLVHINNLGNYKICLNNDNKIFINNFNDNGSINNLNEL